jgi:hypothetical protein
VAATAEPNWSDMALPMTMPTPAACPLPALPLPLSPPDVRDAGEAAPAAAVPEDADADAPWSPEVMSTR